MRPTNQVIEAESEDASDGGPAGDGADATAYGIENDDEVGTEVDEDYYQEESFFPPEDSHSESEEEEPAGFLYGGGRDGGSGSSGGDGRDGVVGAVPEGSFEGDDDGRADSLV